MVPMEAVHPSPQELRLMPRWGSQVQGQAIPAQLMSWRDHGKDSGASTKGT